MFDVFVSYSSKDAIVADAMVHVLEEHGIRCWIAPRDILPGSDYSDSIDKAIEDVKIVIFIHSKRSLESPWCKNEVNLAVKDEKIIVPFKIDDATATGGWNLYLCRSHWIDAVPEPEKKFGEMTRSILSLLGREDQTEKSGVEDSETVFLGRVRRFKNNDGVIDDDEMERLVALASRLGIAPARREELIAKIEDEFEDAHPRARTHGPESKGSAAGEREDGPGAQPAGGESSEGGELADLIVRSFKGIGGIDRLHVFDGSQGSASRKSSERALSIVSAFFMNERILVFCDTTIFAGATGLVLTDEAVYFKNLLKPARRIPWPEMTGVSVRDDAILVSGQKFDAAMIEVADRTMLAATLAAIVDRMPCKQHEDPAAVRIATVCNRITGCSDVFVGARMLQDKLRSAMLSMNVCESRFSVGMQIDTTFFGGAKEGMLLTSKAIYFKNFNEPPVRIEWRSVDRVDVSETQLAFASDKKFEASPNLSADQVLQLREAIIELAEFFKGEVR